MYCELYGALLWGYCVVPEQLTGSRLCLWPHWVQRDGG